MEDEPLCVKEWSKKGEEKDNEGEEEDGAFDFYHEPLTLSALRGNVLPSMKPIVDTSHFWMSDHSRQGHLKKTVLMCISNT